MPFYILTIFLLEIFLLISIGGALGALTTVLWIIVSAIIGINLIKLKNIKILSSNYHSIANNNLDYITTFISGFLLIIPGFLTDFIGLLLCIPLIRNFLYPFIFKSKARTFWSSSSYYKKKDKNKDDNNVIDGDWYED